MGVDLDLQCACDNSEVPKETDFQDWLNAALQNQKSDAEVSIRIVNEDESKTLNHQYRGKDSSTNVLSFPFELPDNIPEDAMGHLLGDLVICADVVEREAIAQNKVLNHHWAHMTVHGVLHLLGFDHIDDQEAEIMENLERKVLATLEIPDPYKSDTEE